MKTYCYVGLHIKLKCGRFHIITPFTFWDISARVYEMFVYKHTETTEYVKK